MAVFTHLGINSRYLISNVSKFDLPKSRTQTVESKLSKIGELLSAWHQDPDYLDKNGKPRPIKLNGGGFSFAHLAKRAVPNVSPNQLLKQLEKVGAVSVDKTKTVRVLLRSLPVYVDRKLAIQHTLTSLDAFLGTLRHNLESAPINSEQLFHRIAWTGDFDECDVPLLKIRMRKHGQNFLESFDNWLLKSPTEKRLLRQRKKVQVSIGLYLAIQKTHQKLKPSA